MDVLLEATAVIHPHHRIKIGIKEVAPITMAEITVIIMVTAVITEAIIVKTRVSI